MNRYVSVSALKHYFNVSNSYVVRKLILVLIPWRHRPWTRQQTRNAGPSDSTQYSSMYLPPRDDLNSPDASEAGGVVWRNIGQAIRISQYIVCLTSGLDD